MGTDEEAAVEFGKAVNMTAKELGRWLDTDESQSAGQKDGDAESTGHASGRRIVELLRTNKADLSEDVYAHMRTVLGYVHRHLAQRPSGDVTDTSWRYSLINWATPHSNEVRRTIALGDRRRVLDAGAVGGEVVADAFVGGGVLLQPCREPGASRRLPAGRPPRRRCPRRQVRGSAPGLTPTGRRMRVGVRAMGRRRVASQALQYGVNTR